MCVCVCESYHSLKIIHNNKWITTVGKKMIPFCYFDSPLHLFQNFAYLCIPLLYIPSIGCNSFFIMDEFNWMDAQY